jgi:hypothetical protein
LYGQQNIAQLIANITSVDAATKTITLDRPLPYNYSTNWFNVSVHAWAPSTAVSEFGGVGGREGKEERREGSGGGGRDGSGVEGAGGREWREKGGREVVTGKED